MQALFARNYGAVVNRSLLLEGLLWMERDAGQFRPRPLFASKCERLFVQSPFRCYALDLRKAVKNRCWPQRATRAGGGTPLRPALCSTLAAAVNLAVLLGLSLRATRVAAPDRVEDSLLGRRKYPPCKIRSYRYTHRPVCRPSSNPKRGSGDAVSQGSRGAGPGSGSPHGLAGSPQIRSESCCRWICVSPSRISDARRRGRRLKCPTNPQPPAPTVV